MPRHGRRASETAGMISSLRPSTTPTTDSAITNAIAVTGTGAAHANPETSSTSTFSHTRGTTTAKPPVPHNKPSTLRSNPTLPPGASNDAYSVAWNYRQPVTAPVSSSTQVSRLAKIKSSPAHGALAAARQVESEAADAHQRSGSLSAAAPLTINTPGNELNSVYECEGRSAGQPSRHLVFGSVTSLGGLSATKPKTKIKPLLRKLKSQEEPSLDLSRSMADQEGLAYYGDDTGLGYQAGSNMASAASVDRARGMHGRSSSGTSQFSTTTSSSGNRAYVHPMRQTPRPYTPPIASARTYGEALDDEDRSPEAEHARRQHHLDANWKAPPDEFPPTMSMPIHYSHQYSSTGNLNRSQTHLPGTPSSGHFPSTGSPADTMSPTSRRSSIDKLFTKRSRTVSDPVVHAASIHAARQAFNERQAIKEVRAQQEENKALGREILKQEKLDSKRNKSRAARAEFNEKDEDGVGGREYSTLTSGAMPGANDEASPRLAVNKSMGLKKPKVPRWWMEFVIWFKTRIFKMNRTVSRKVRGTK